MVCSCWGTPHLCFFLLHELIPTFPVETADGVEVTGRAAALYNKSVYEQYAGELTDEAVAHVLDDFVDLRDAHGEHSFNWPVIYDNFSIFELLIRLTVSVQNMDISALLMRSPILSFAFSLFF